MWHGLLLAKLCFLQRMLDDGDKVGMEMMRPMSDDVELICLVKECHEWMRVLGHHLLMRC